MQGKVIKKAVGRYWVKVGGRVVECSVSNRLRKRLLYPTADPNSIRPHVVGVKEIRTTDPVAVGDEVVFRKEGEGAAVITEVLPRQTKLNRRAAGRQPLEQVIAANVDQVVAVMAAAKPAPKWRLLDRYLADAEHVEMPVVVCMTKMDLVAAGEPDGLSEYERIGYRVVRTSAVTGRGLAEMKEVLRDRTTVLVGKSGVGKSTLLNALEPGLGLAVQEVGRSGKGRHTTSNLEMLDLGFGGYVVDTPGMREFGLWGGKPADIAWLFREMRPFLGRCRFGTGCTHSHEPGCAVKAAVASGEVSEARYRSLLRMAGRG